MKAIKALTDIIREDSRATIHSAKNSIRQSKNHAITIRYVFSQPINVLYGIFGTFVSIAVAVWLANVQIIQQLFESPTLSTRQRFEFLFDIFSPTLRNIDALQLWMIVLFGIGSLLVWASWMEALKQQHDNEKLRVLLAPLLLASLVAAAIGIIGVSLVTPVITREGLSVFVSQHYSGTIVLFLGIIMQLKISHLFMHRLYPAAEKSRKF